MCLTPDHLANSVRFRRLLRLAQTIYAASRIDCWAGLISAKLVQPGYHQDGKSVGHSSVSPSSEASCSRSPGFSALSCEAIAVARYRRLASR